MFLGTPKHAPKLRFGDRVWIYERRAVHDLPAGLINFTPLTYVEWPNDFPRDSSFAALMRDDGKIFKVPFGLFERAGFYNLDGEWLPESDSSVLNALTRDLETHLIEASKTDAPRLHHLREARHLAFVLMRNGRPAPEIPT